MSRCNCESGTTCACKIVAEDTDCIDVTVAGTGTLVSPYTISAVPIIDPAAGNQLECGSSGLLVPAAAAPPLAGHVIKDEGIALAQRAGLNFLGNEVVATDDAGGNETDVTINHLATAVHSVAQPITVRENSGADVGTRPRLNFIEGTNITLTVADDAGSNEVDITINGAAGATGHVIEDEGVPLAQRTGLNFIGDSVVATDDAGGDETDVTINHLATATHSVAQPLTVRENSGANVGTRPRINLIEGTNILLTVADDAVDNEVDITFNAPAFGSPVAIGTANADGVATTIPRSDHVHAAGTDWAAYTPTNVNITVGNGTQVARFARVGDTVFWSYHLLWGSTTAFTTVPQVGLPVAAAATSPIFSPVGSAILNDTDGSDSTGQAHIISAGGGSVRIMTDSTGGVVTSTAPFTWTTGDVLAIGGSYEV